MQILYTIYISKHSTMKYITLFSLYLILFSLTDSFSQEYNYQWARQAGGQSTVSGKTVHIDDFGNVIVGGTWEEDLDFDPPNLLDTISSTHPSESLYLVKYDYYGSYLWSFVLESTGFGDLEILSMKTDPHGNIYIGGAFGSPFDLDPSPSDTVMAFKNGDKDAFLAKYSPEGEYIWSIILNNTWGYGEKYVDDIELDQFGNIYITGSFEQQVDFDPDTSEFNISGSSNSIYIAKYSPTRELLDIHFFYSPGAFDSVPIDIAVDRTGSVYVTGELRSNNFAVNGFTYPSGDFLDGQGFGDIFLIKLNHDLNPVWYHAIGTPSSEVPRAMVLDDSANIYLTGGFVADIDMNPDPVDVWQLSDSVPGSNQLLFLAKYDSSGHLRWAKQFDGISTGSSLSLGAQNDIFLGYYRIGNVWLNPGEDSLYSNSSLSGIALARLRNDGHAESTVILENVTSFPTKSRIDTDLHGNWAVTNQFIQPADLDLSIDSAIFNSVHYFDAITVRYSPCELDVVDVLGPYTYSQCIGDSVLLTVDSLLVSSAYWSNGDSGFHSYFFPGEKGYVIADSICKFHFHIDSILLDTIAPISIIASSDTLCHGDSVLLEISPGSYSHAMWSTGSTDTAIYVQSAGEYIVEVSKACANPQRDTLSIMQIDPINPFSIQADTDTLCQGDSLLLDLPHGSYQSIIWSTGATDSSIYVYTGGEYVVEVSNTCFSQQSDTLRIKEEDCTTSIEQGYYLGNIDLFPNPNQGTFVLKSPRKVEIKITNLLGQVIYTNEQFDKHHKIQLPEEIPNGMYLVLVLDERNQTIETRPFQLSR